MRRTIFRAQQGRGSRTYILIANANGAVAAVTASFLLENGSVVTRSYNVAANGRFTIHANDIAELKGRAFSTTMTSSVPVTVERAMYWNGGGQFWGAGTNETAVRVR